MSFILLGILNSQAAGAGGAAAYDLLETEVLTSSASSVSFTGLGSYTDYKHLQIRMVSQGDQTGSDNYSTYINFNSDTGSNYAYHRLIGSGSSVSSFASSNQAEGYLGVSSGSSVADRYGAFVVDILDFADSNKNTTVRSLSGNSVQVHLDSSLYISTSAITSTEISISTGSFTAGSRFSIYGIKG